MNARTKPLHDVIVAGAGPVGLFLACELALAGCSVRVLEQAGTAHSPLKRLPFGIRGLSAPTIEALARRGLLQELELHKRLKHPHQNSVQGARRQVGHFAGIPFHEGDVDPSQWPCRLPGTPPPSLICEMEELEAVLSRRAAALGVTLERGLAVSGLAQAGDSVSVQAGGRTFQCRWLAGCDGSRSAVRKAGGFEFAGTEPEFTGYTASVDIADPDTLKPGRNMTPAGMYLQSQPGHLVVQDFDGGAFHDARAPVTRAHLQQVLRRVSGTDVTLDALHLASTWTDRARQATHYRNGRVVLAGDAAHIHAPLGGQGLNLGLGDALNLGWKLAATIRNGAPESLLDSYQAERHPIGAQVLDWSRAQVALMRPDPHARALNAIVRDLIGTRDGATYFAGRVWGISTHYPADGGHPLVGHRVPSFQLEDGTSVDGLMRDGRGLLLDFGRDASLRSLASDYGDRLAYVAGPAQEQLGLGAVLIRPDGFIAWAAGDAADCGELRKAAERWFGAVRTSSH